MIELSVIQDWLKARKLRKKKRQEWKIHKELFAKTVTIHGRLELSNIVQDESYPAEMRRMYYTILKDAPIQEWSIWN